jgi:O-methyltransferase
VIQIDPATIDAFDANDPIRALYRRAIDKSMGGKPDNAIKQLRYYVMHQLAESAVRIKPRASVVECGCWKGHSTLIIANLMQRHRMPSARLHVFDSFEGLSAFGPKDKSAARKPEDAKRGKYATDMERLAALVAPLGFVDLHKGWIPEVFDNADVGAISFANIDVNLYEPTLASLAFVYPRLALDSVVFFDDYGYKTCPGATAAIDEYLGGRGGDRPATFVALPFGSAFLVR